MTSLPMSPGLSDSSLSGFVPGSATGCDAIQAASPAATDEQHLLRAFRTFAETAGSLEYSYSLLRAEVARLRRELEESHAGLARSLEQNRSMRQHLDRILESLPCGVVVVSSSGGGVRGGGRRGDVALLSRCVSSPVVVVVWGSRLLSLS